MSTIDDDLADLDEPTRPEDLPDTADDPMFDGDIAAMLEEATKHEQACDDMRRLGRRLGALHQGLVEQGVCPEDATGVVHDWMRCAVFREVDRETGTHDL